MALASGGCAAACRAASRTAPRPPPRGPRAPAGQGRAGRAMPCMCAQQDGDRTPRLGRAGGPGIMRPRFGGSAPQGQCAGGGAA